MKLGGCALTQGSSPRSTHILLDERLRIFRGRPRLGICLASPPPVSDTRSQNVTSHTIFFFETISQFNTNIYEYIS